jgi:hypothetical protein
MYRERVLPFVACKVHPRAFLSALLDLLASVELERGH